MYRCRYFVSGFDLITITQGLSSIKIDGNVTVFASEDQLDLSLGHQTLEQSTNESVSGQALSSSQLGTVVPEPKIPVDVTGISATLSLGSISLVQTTVESVTGQLATFAQGAQNPVAIFCNNCWIISVFNRFSFCSRNGWGYCNWYRVDSKYRLS